MEGALAPDDEADLVASPSSSSPATGSTVVAIVGPIVEIIGIAATLGIGVVLTLVGIIGLILTLSFLGQLALSFLGSIR